MPLYQVGTFLILILSEVEIDLDYVEPTLPSSLKRKLSLDDDTVCYNILCRDSFLLNLYLSGFTNIETITLSRTVECLFPGTPFMPCMRCNIRHRTESTRTRQRRYRQRSMFRRCGICLRVSAVLNMCFFFLWASTQERKHLDMINGSPWPLATRV